MLEKMILEILSNTKHLNDYKKISYDLSSCFVALKNNEWIKSKELEIQDEITKWMLHDREWGLGTSACAFKEHNSYEIMQFAGTYWFWRKLEKYYAAVGAKVVQLFGSHKGDSK